MTNFTTKNLSEKVHKISIDFCFEICYNNNVIGNKPIAKQNETFKKNSQTFIKKFIDFLVQICYNNNVLKVQCSKVVNRVTRKPTEKK